MKPEWIRNQEWKNPVLSHKNSLSRSGSKDPHVQLTDDRLQALEAVA